MRVMTLAVAATATWLMVNAGDANAQGMRGGGRGGQGGGGRPNVGARPNPGAARPQMNRPQANFNRPNAAPSFRPQAAARPNPGARPNLPNPGAGARPNFPAAGARPNIQRPTANPSLRPNAPTTRPNLPNHGGMLNPGGIKPVTRPGAGGGGIQNPNIRPNLPNRPGAGGGGIQNPNLPNFGNRPGAGGGGIQNPNIRPNLPNRPGAGGGGIQNPNLRPNWPNNRPGGGGTQWPNRPDWGNRPGGGGGGTQWPNRPDWANRPGGGGGGTQWPNRPGGNWNNRPNGGDLGHWLNLPNHNNWRPNNNGRWQNWNNVGNNYNTFINNQSTVVRNNLTTNNFYGNYGSLFTPNWYGNAYRGGYFGNYPAAAASNYYWWNAATQSSLNSWLAWNTAQPVYYNYGSNVDYQGDTVYVDQQPVANSEAYIGQAMQLAQAGINALSQVAATNANVQANAAQPPAYSGPDWMPLGVFAVTSEDEKGEPTRFLQLAVTKDGVIGGTYQNTGTGQNQNLAGKVDKESQRAAWSPTENPDMVMEAGIYNLTQDQAPVLVHWGKEKTQTWLMTRIPAPKQ